jgi:Tol biopolymer transport system component
MIGKTLGPYTLTDALGAGGMGEVYRAHDARLDREVAIKVLPADMASNTGAMARFETEAKAIAALSHPNIVAIFDVGQEGETAFVVTELLEGEALSDLLLEGPLPYRTAADYAREIALGLAAAHDRDIVHRDVKPANVFVTTDGRVKLLDFGLAKASSLMSGTHSDSVQATVIGTEPGTILGTVGYMAPEQVRGEPADARSDIFALGSVLFEMLDGRAAFRRDTSAETMTAILREEPPAPSSGAQQLPRSLERVVRHCLEKRPDDRFQTARDLAFAIDNASVTSGSEIVPPPSASGASRSRRLSSVPLAATIGLALVAAIAAFVVGRTQAPAAVVGKPARLRQLTFSGADFEAAASPDGRQVVFRSHRNDEAGLWIKQLSTGGERRLTSGQDATPRFHPDGASVLFTRLTGLQTDLHRIGLLGEQPRRLVTDALQGDWSPDGTRIAFVRGTRADAMLGVYDVGNATEVELFNVEGLALEDPRFSPDGTTIAVTQLPTTNAAGSMQQVLIDAQTGVVTTMPAPALPTAMTGVSWSASGDALIYGLAANSTGDRTGQPGRVVRQEIATGEITTLFWTAGMFPQRAGSAGFGAVERIGTDRLALGVARIGARLREIPLGASDANATGRALTLGDAQDRQPVYSRDGRSILFSSNRSGNLDLWTVDRETLKLTQITDDAAQDWDPAFTPDGQNILWSSDRNGTLQVWMSDLQGNGARQVTNAAQDAQNPTLTGDGEWIVYASGDPQQLGLHRARLDGTEDAIIVSIVVGIPETAPTGAWVAFSDVGRARGTRLLIVDALTGEFLDIGEVIHLPAMGIVGNRDSTLSTARPRWLNAGTLAFTAAVPGRIGNFIYARDIVEGVDTSSTERVLVTSPYGEVIETFGISPDGRFVTVAFQTSSHTLAIADQVHGLE